ncbi:hypothetical protein B0H16DRAFT_1476992 [Mycena metata]|uniref:Uncharacterized protein n=1 Tax=Mycena metata TaxID=1033252 RepID=A0AAD7MH52_9AGAR|nr:hypothetical protein B0H16DRAFT_1476992 [Mycena metata]
MSPTLCIISFSSPSTSTATSMVLDHSTLLVAKVVLGSGTPPRWLWWHWAGPYCEYHDITVNYTQSTSDSCYGPAHFAESDEDFPLTVIAPSQYQMVLVLCNASEVSKDRVSFRNDVHGPETICLPHLLRQTGLQCRAVHQRRFLYFTIDGQPMAKDTEVKAIRRNDAIPAEVGFIGRRPVPRHRVSSGIGRSSGEDSIATRHFHRVKS